MSEGRGKKEAPPAPITYARKGEQITCINGHVICEMGKDVRCGDMFYPDHLVNWTQEPPKSGTPISQCTCAQCGARYVAEGATFHFANGWRTYTGLNKPNQ